jgi:hypothetical protein
MTRFLDPATLSSYVRSELTVDLGFYEQAIEAAEDWLDSMCRRRIILATTSTARTFNAPTNPTRFLYVNDFTTVTSVVENGATLTAGTMYQAEPLNGLDDEGASVPYYRLVKPYTSWYSTTNLASITVTAAWGWPAIPPMLIEACKIVAKDYFLQRDVAHGVIGITEVGGVGTRENRLVQDAVARFKRGDKFGLA